MKITLHLSHALFAGAALLLTAQFADARAYGVSGAPAARGTSYTTSRGGSAYVGPHGAAAQGANGRTAVATDRGAAAVGPRGAVATTRPVPGQLPAYGPSRTVVATKATVVVAPLPSGYIRVVPTGYTTVVYGGYTCRYVGGIFYRPVMYQGTTVYVVVR